jgi:hypothetical protein
MPQYELLYRRGVIDARQRAVLAWYDLRLAEANSGMFRNPLAAHDGGGAPGAGIPINQMALDASREVDWARAAIMAVHSGNAVISVLDAVMRDELTFVEAARRECARRHVRASVSRERRRWPRRSWPRPAPCWRPMIAAFPRGRAGSSGLNIDLILRERMI